VTATANAFGHGACVVVVGNGKIDSERKNNKDS